VTADPSINLSHISFTSAGSLLAIESEPGGSPKAVYKTRSGFASSPRGSSDWNHDFFEIVLLSRGHRVPYKIAASVSQLVLTAGPGVGASFAFADDHTLSFSATGVTVQLASLKPLDVRYRRRADHLVVTDARANGVHSFKSFPGTRIQWDESQKFPQIEFQGRDRTAGAFRFQLFEQDVSGKLPTFESARQKQRKLWLDWNAKAPTVMAPYRAASTEAWAMLHLNRVSVGGLITRPTIYSNKGSMTGIWSWDNCFHALAVAQADPTLAFDQLRLLFDHQTEAGQIPDMMSDSTAHYSYTKPPIYGWTVSKLIDVLGAETCRDAVADLYGPISSQTEWWFRFRDVNKNGMCAYLNGNDSGWDNSTVFDQGQPTEGADLASHLVLQMEGLARMATLLGKRADSRRWKERSAQQLKKLLQKNLRHGRFFSPLEGKSRALPCQSLLNYIPIMLGRRLPAKALNTLVGDLSADGPFMTTHGLASEAIKSAKFESDGYWRGPVWSPPQ
jgi:putative isomerase